MVAAKFVSVVAMVAAAVGVTEAKESSKATVAMAIGKQAKTGIEVTDSNSMVTYTTATIGVAHNKVADWVPIMEDNSTTQNSKVGVVHTTAIEAEKTWVIMGTISMGFTPFVVVVKHNFIVFVVSINFASIDRLSL